MVKIMSGRVRRLTSAVVGLFVLLASVEVFAQLPAQIGSMRRASGQSVAPVYEGWEPNPDGSFTMYFGYFSMNTEETADIPVGANNFIEPAPQDRGQPTHFLPNRHKRIFSLPVPKDFGTKTLTWTITRGIQPPQRITGSLAEMYRIEALRSEGMDRMGPSVSPTVDAGPDQTIVLPQTATLTVVVKSEGTARVRGGGAQVAGGSPRDAQVAGGSPRDVSRGSSGEGTSRVKLQWFLYRGADKVTIANTRPPVSRDGKAVTTVTFSAPGTYRFQVIADDGSSGQEPEGNPNGSLCCWSDDTVTIEVKAPPGR
jgi:hypothetical protein